MAESKPNKFRQALGILQNTRDRLVDEMAEQVVDQANDFVESPYLFNEFLEGQGTRLHFLSMMVAHLEQSAEQAEEAEAAAEAEMLAERELEEAPPVPAPRRRSRQKKLAEQTQRENEPGET